MQIRKQLNNRTTKRQRFHPIWSKKLTFSHITSYTRNPTQQTAPQRPIFTTDDSTHYQQKHTLKIVPVALHNHINNLFSGITKQLNNTYAIHKKQPTSLWQATEKTHLFFPGYRTTNLTFTGNPKTFIRAIPTTRHSPNSEETQNHWTPNEACNRKASLNPKRHETEQSRETPLPNTWITTKAFHTPDKQLKHNNERNRPSAITPYTEKNNHQNDENTP